MTESAQPARRLIKAAGIFTILFGLLMAAAALPALSGPLSAGLDLVFWPMDGQQAVDQPQTRLLAAILGGVMAGFGVMIVLVTDALADRPAALFRVLTLSLAVWFVIDSTGSIASGGALNALLNVGFLALFVPGLMALRRL